MLASNGFRSMQKLYNFLSLSLSFCLIFGNAFVWKDANDICSSCFVQATFQLIYHRERERESKARQAICHIQTHRACMERLIFQAIVRMMLKRRQLILISKEIFTCLCRFLERPHSISLPLTPELGNARARAHKLFSPSWQINKTHRKTIN